MYDIESSVCIIQISFICYRLHVSNLSGGSLFSFGDTISQRFFHTSKSRPPLIVALIVDLLSGVAKCFYSSIESENKKRSLFYTVSPQVTKL